jgi:hypothetical protein
MAPVGRPPLLQPLDRLQRDRQDHAGLGVLPRLGQLVGGYFFADYCSGKLWSIAATSTWPATRVQHVDSPLQITSFGEDEFGNVYIVFQQGYVYRLTGTPKP